MKREEGIALVELTDGHGDLLQLTRYDVIQRATDDKVGSRAKHSN